MDENAIPPVAYRLLRTDSGRDGMEPAFQHAGSRTRPADESGSGTLPKPEEVKSMMRAFTAARAQHHGRYAAGRGTGADQHQTGEIARVQQANGAGSDSSVNAETGEIARRAISEANLWLDTACEFNPAQGETQLLTRAGLGGGHNRRVGAVRLPRGRIDERRSELRFCRSVSATAKYRPRFPGFSQAPSKFRFRTR